MAKDQRSLQEGFDKIVDLFGDVDRKLKEIKGLILEINTQRAAERIAAAREAAAAARTGVGPEQDRRAPEGEAGSESLYCSFCGKGRHDVAKLVAGPDVFICDECVELCADVVRVEKKVGKD